VVEEPAGVEVQVNGGHVVLSGSASLEEMDSLARTIAGMHGVTDVENRLDDGQQAGSLDAGPATH
jgi:osmotically-inducible protein OsmY